MRMSSKSESMDLMIYINAAKLYNQAQKNIEATSQSSILLKFNKIKADIHIINSI